MKATARVGQRWGRWTILRPLIPRADEHTFFLCRCECGEERPVSGAAMYKGRSKGCKSCAARDRKAYPEHISVVADRYGVCRTTVGYGIRFLGWDGMIEHFERSKKGNP